MTKQQTIRTLIYLSGCDTQKAFATKHEIRPEIISKWLSGDRNICDKTLKEIAKNEGFKLTIELKLERL